MSDKDIGGKYLIDRDPEGWARWLLNDPTLMVIQVLSSEFQFVTRRGDVLLQVETGEESFILLVELQLHHDATMPARMQNYCAMARQKFRLPVLPLVVYLTEPTSGVEVATSYHSEFRGQVTHQDFMVLKLWELDAHEVLNQDLPVTLLPYVPLMAGADEAVVQECVRRIRREANHEELETILALFAMIKLDAEVVTRIVRWHVTILEKSPIYQEILEKGQAKELRRNILRILERRFGADTAVLQPRLESLPLPTLETLFDEALAASDLPAFESRLTAVSLHTTLPDDENE